MDALWAPWRAAYVSRLDEPRGCFLCAASKEGDDLLVRRGEAALVILNRYPYNNGHLLVAPHRHVADLADLTDAEWAEARTLLSWAEARLRAAVRPDGFNAGINLGRTAGAGLEGHFHLHLVPRWNGDTNFMPVLGATKVISQSLEEMAKLLKE